MLAMPLAKILTKEYGDLPKSLFKDALFAVLPGGRGAFDGG